MLMPRVILLLGTRTSGGSVVGVVGLGGRLFVLVRAGVCGGGLFGGVGGG